MNNLPPIYFEIQRKHVTTKSFCDLPKSCLAGKSWNDKGKSVSLKKEIKNAVIQIRQLITGPNQHKNEIIPDADIRKELELKLRELEE